MGADAALRVVIATATGGGPFDGVFWKSYLEHGGPEPESVLYIHSDSGRGILRKAMESPLLFRLTEVARLASANFAEHSLTRSDRSSGLHLGIEDLFGHDVVRPVASLNAEPGRSLLSSLKPDILVSVGSPEIFTEKVLDIPTKTCLNVHNGRLPRYRGRFGTFWELANREDRGWVTVHKMTLDIDAGDILAEASVDLDNGLFDALVAKKKTGGRLLASVFTGSRVCGNSAVRSQRDEDSAYHSWPTLSDLWRHRSQLVP